MKIFVGALVLTSLLLANTALADPVITSDKTNATGNDEAFFTANQGANKVTDLHFVFPKALFGGKKAYSHIFVLCNF